MSALNFGMSYPKGDQDALFDLGDAWKKAAADLEKLEPDLRSVTGRLPQFYDSDGAAKVSAELATLFDGSDYSVQKLVECLNQLGHDTRATATEIEYAKIQSEIFALLTLYTVLQLSITLFGEALVPEVLLTARETLRIFAEKVMERIGLLRARAALETLAQPLLREIAVPLGEKLAAPLAEKVVAPLAEKLATKPLLNTALQYGGKSIVAGLGAGAMGAGLDAGTQFIQILEGHRDDGFNLKQTFQTGLQWGVGGAVGAPFHAKVGDLLRDTRLPSRLGGAIAGGVGGGMGAVGMYGTGLATQLYDNGGDWSKVDKTFHTEMLIGGLAMGVGGGANHGMDGHGAPGDTAVPTRTGPDGSAPHTPEPEVRAPAPEVQVAGEQPEHGAQHDVHPAAASEQPVSHEPADAGTGERAAPASEAPRNDLQTTASTAGDGGSRNGDAGTKVNDAGPKASDAGPKAGDTGTRPSDTGTKLGDVGPKTSEPGPKLSETTSKPADAAAPRAGTPAPQAGEGPRAATAATDHRGNVVSGAQDRAAPMGRTPEARPVEAASDTQTRATPTESNAKTESPAGKQADRTGPTGKSPEADPSRRDPAPDGSRPEDSTPDRAEHTPKEPAAQRGPQEKPVAEAQRENEHRDSRRPDGNGAAPETHAPKDSVANDIAPALVVTPMPGEMGRHEGKAHSPDAAKSDARDGSRARAHDDSKPLAAQDPHTPADPSKHSPTEGDWSPRPDDEWSQRDSGEVAKELADKWGLEVSGFDHPRLDPEVAREFARAIDEMLTRYPDVKLRKVSIDSIGDPGTYAATYEGHSPSGRMYTDEVVLDRDYALDPERMAREIAEDEADGHLVPGSADRPIHSTLVHEFGHVLAIESQEHAEVNAYKALAEYFEATRGGMDKDAFHEWLDQLSGYSFDEHGRFDAPEAVAEAFTDVEYHGEGATEPARVLYHHLLDSARDHGSTPDGFRHRPDDAIGDPRPRKGKSPSSSEPGGERDGPTAAPPPESPETGRHSAPDVESYLEEPRVSAALDRADELGVTTSINGVDTPVSTVIRDLLPQHPELAELLRSNEHLEHSLLARPKTLASLLTHPDGLPVLHDAVEAVAERGPEAVLADPVHIEPTPLTPAERAMSHEIRDAVSDVPASSRRQPEFDYSRIEDPEYQREFLRKQYDIWRASQDALNDVVRDIARETEGTPGWRAAPKDETRAWDKIKGYDGDVSRLTDLVGAKIVFDHVSDAYRALEMIENDPRVRIVEFEDRFDRPTPSGYRDLQMKVQLENGHIAELRLHLSHIDAVAGYEHALYEVQRDFKALAKDENRAMHPEEAALSTELKRNVSGRFWEATQQGLSEEHTPTGQEPPERRPRARRGIPDEPTPDPGSMPPDAPRELTPELRGSFEELRGRAAEIDRAAADPARADELTNLRERFAEQFDGLGLRDSENSGAMWQLFDRHDPALSKYLADYSRDFLPLAAEAEPGPVQLKDQFEQVRAHINDIFAATNDPARAPELPELRAKFGELVDSIGLRDQQNWGPAWQSFKEHDAALAQYVEQNHEHLLPRPDDVAGPGENPPAPEPIKPLAGYQGNFHQDAQDIVSALESAGRPDLAQKFTDLVNREVDGGNVGGLEDWMGETAPRARASDTDQVLDKAAELTELDRLSREAENDPELRVRFNPGVAGDKSFDILVERTTSDGATTVERRVEIERMKQLPEQSSSLHGAALHGADKAVAPVPNRTPSAETTVVMPANPPEGRVQPLGGGNERRFGANGWDYEIVDPNGNVRKTGNLLDELAKSFNVNKKLHPNMPNLDAVTFVDENGNLLGQIVRGGDGWRKVQ
ncbi:WXG100-like domain-containing protein [Nocardia tengchongensis]